MSFIFFTYCSKVESVHKNIFWTGMFISLIISVYTLTPRTAALFSRRGKEIVFIGTSLFFDVTKEQCGIFNPNSNFKYATAPYANSEASQNTCSCISLAKYPGWCWHLGIVIPFRFTNFPFHFSHYLYCCLVILSSHSTFSLHNACKNIFLVIKRGATIPTGSIIDATVFRMFLLVTSSSLTFTVSKVKISFVTSDLTPTVYSFMLLLNDAVWNDLIFLLLVLSSLHFYRSR